MADLGDRVYYRAGAADGSTVSTAIVTAVTSDTVLGLAIKPDQAAWLDRPAVNLLGTQTLDSECWSPWPFQ